MLCCYTVLRPDKEGREVAACLDAQPEGAQASISTAMCGRMNCTRSCQAVASSYHVPSSRIRRAERHRVSQNFHPGMSAPVVVSASSLGGTSEDTGSAAAAGGDDDGGVSTPSGKGVDPGRAVVVMAWGLVPSFTKPHDKPDFFRAFNARSETICDKPFFKRLVNRRRCVVVLEGFYEWQKLSNGQKQPFYLHFQDGRPMTMPGLWDTWHQQEGDVLYSFTILTTEPCPAIAWLHNRMPVIFRNQEDEAKWLDTDHHKAEELLKELCQPYDRPDLVWHAVDRKVGSFRYQGDDCTTPVEASTGSQRPAKKPNEGTPTLKAFFQAKQQPDTSSPQTKHHAVKQELLPSSPPPGPASPFAPRRGGLGVVMKKEEEEEEAVNTDESVDQKAGGGVKHAARESLLLQALEKRPHGEEEEKDEEEEEKGQQQQSKESGATAAPPPAASANKRKPAPTSSSPAPPALTPAKKKQKQHKPPPASSSGGQRTLQAFFSKASPSK